MHNHTVWKEKFWGKTIRTRTRKKKIMKYRSGGNPDKNQAEIVKALRRSGAKVTITSEVSNFCDLVVGFNGNVFLVEVKDGSLFLSKRKLTPGEQKCKEEYEYVGVRIWLIESIEEALEMIGYCDNEYHFKLVDETDLLLCDICHNVLLSD